MLHHRHLRVEWLEDRSLLSVAPTGVDLLPVSDTGIFNDDNLTNLDNSTPTKALQFEVAGTIAGATVTLYTGSTPIGTAVATGETTTVTTNGAYDLIDGGHVITARQTEIGDTESSDSSGLGITVDIHAPQTPVLPDLQTASDTGFSSTDNITCDNTPTFAAIGAPYFRLYRDGVQISGDYQSGSSWTLPTQADGTYSYTATAVDAAGNESAPSEPLVVTIDTQAPPTPPALDLQADSDTGVSDSDNITNLTTLTFDVDASPYYRVYRGTTRISGLYESDETHTVTSPPLGVYDHTVTAVDAAGNESAKSEPVQVTIDLTPPVRIDHIAKLLAGDGATSDYFGFSVAIDGATAIVGAYQDDDKGSNSGSAYIFKNIGSEWVQVAKLTASDGFGSDYFGRSVAISGSVAVVGAVYDDDKGSNSGSAYIFADSGSGWIQVAKLTAANGAATDYFGNAVAITGNTVLVAAYQDDDKGSNSGSVYVFKNTGSSWVQTAKLTAGDGAASDSFGSSVSISGSVAIVGAYQDDDKGGDSGSAYIFNDTGAGWTQVAKLTANDGATTDYFGYSVAIDGSTAVVGAYQDDDKGGNSGSAYIFEDTGSGWTQVAKLTADDGAVSDYFGYSVSISGSRVVIGAYQDDDTGADSGSAYLFEDTGSGWTQVSKSTAADGAAGDYFGRAVSVSGSLVVVGAYQDDDKGNSSGSIYLFTDAAWLADDTGLSPYDGITGDTTPELRFRFSEPVHGPDGIVTLLDRNGDPVALAPIAGWGTDTISVGASAPLTLDGEYTVILSGEAIITDLAGNPLSSGPDKVMTFTLLTVPPAVPAPPDLQASSDTGVSDTDNLTNDNTPTFDAIGAPYFRLYRDGVQISGDYETGSYTDASLPDGVYQYTMTAVDLLGNESPPSDPLVVTIDTEAPSAPVAAPALQGDSDTGLSNSDNLTNDTTPTFDAIGEPYLRLYRDGVLVSSNYETENHCAAHPQPDGTYQYTVKAVDAAGNESAHSPAVTVTIDSTAPTRTDQIAKLLAGDGATSDYFGYSVAISDNIAIVGAYQDDDKGYDSGSAYIFEATGSGWVQIAKLIASDGAAFDYFGYSVAIDGNTAVVGAYQDDDKGSDSGSAYIFEKTASGWVQAAKLTADDGATADHFGRSVSISGSVVIVGAYQDDDQGTNSGSAYVFRHTDSVWIQVSKLTDDDGEASDYFGYSVSISGSLAIVGAYYDDDKGADSGSAYIFKDSGSGWVQIAKLTAADGEAGDSFGKSVSVSGNVAIVGAHLDDDKGTNSGSAYIFEDCGTEWIQVAKLAPTDGTANDRFGCSVAISANVAIVGEYYDDDKGGDSGSAYIFQDSGSGWGQIAKLTPADGAADDYFGGSVSISGTMAVVGTYADDDNGSASGSAYLFDAVAELTDDTGVQANDQITRDTTPELTFAFNEPVFGHDDDVVVLDPNGEPVTPDAVIGWESRFLVISFTTPLTVDGEYTVTLGGPETPTDMAGNPLNDGRDKTIVFTLDTLSPPAPPAPDLQAASDTGISDTDNITADNTPTFDMVGAPYFRVYRDGVQISVDYATGTSFTDAALPDGTYAYTLIAVDSAGNESLPSEPLVVIIDTQAPPTPVAPDLQAASDTGVSNADNMTNDTTPTFEVNGFLYFRVYRNGVRISSSYEPGSSFTDAELPDGTYQYTITAVDTAGNESEHSLAVSVTIDSAAPVRADELAKLVAADRTPQDWFGYSVSVSGSRTIVGAHHDSCNGTDSGAAYIFEFTSLGWVQVAKLVPDDIAAGDLFGKSVSISGSLAIVGAYLDDDKGSNSGSAYIFQDSGSGWTQIAKLLATDGRRGDYFGGNVAISGNSAIVGAHASSDSGSSSGSAYIFENTESGWVQVAKLTAADAALGDFFGISVGISGDTAIVGAYQDDDNGTNSGSAYIFSNTGSAWVQTKKLKASDGAAGDQFGWSVSISDNVAIVGAREDDSRGIDSGSVYFFERIGSQWSQTAKRVASDGEEYDNFGQSVSISGNMAIVGADLNNGAVGSAYLFRRTDSNWTQIAKLAADDGSPWGGFGNSVSISDTTAVVGAWQNAGGSAYILTQVPVLALHPASDTGSNNSDNVTTDNTPTFDIIGSPYFRVYRDEVQISGDYETGDTYTAPAQPDGTYQYTVRAVDAAGNLSVPSESLTVTLDTTAPTAAHVLVKGSAWTDAFLDSLDAQELGHPGVARLGYRLPGGGGQFDSLGWGNIDMVSIAFSDDVVVTQNHLTLAGVNVAEYTITGFSYDPATYVATWTLAQPIGADRVSISLSDAVEDIAGNALDGEWQDAQSQFPSGDGEPGGHFGFGFHVLPGDANRDGTVNAVDASIMAAHFGRTGATARVGDFDGNGTVDAEDAKILAARWGMTLPAIPEGSAVDPVVDDQIAVEPVADETTSIDPVSGQSTPNDPTAPPPVLGDPVAAIDAAFVGPLPAVGSLSPARRLIEPASRIRPAAMAGRAAMAGSVELMLDELDEAVGVMAEERAALVGEESTYRGTQTNVEQRVERSAKPSVEQKAEQRAYALRSPFAVSDAALAEEYGSALESSSPQHRHAAWSNTLARRGERGA